MFTRRTIIRIAGAATLAGCGRQATTVPTTQRDIGTDAPDHAALDQALSELHRTDPEFDGGLSNHGPMACEALEALGASDRIEPFFRRYRGRLEPMPAAEPLADWKTELGNPQARAALVASMEARLEDAGPEALLRETLPDLLSGLIGGALHGLLRTAHAYRAWTRHGSDVRARELAHGLGYWAARHQPLPGMPSASAQPGHGASAVLAATPIVPIEERHAGLIFERFVVLEGAPSFAEAVEAYDPNANAPDATLDTLVSSAARLYVSTKAPGAAFVYLHGVTGSSALRLLLPAMSDAEQRRAVGYLVQAVAAVHATHAQPGSTLAGEIPTVDAAPEVLGRAAAATDDDHTIKLVEAALREHARDGAPELLAAAAKRVG